MVGEKPGLANKVVAFIILQIFWPKATSVTKSFPA